MPRKADVGVTLTDLFCGAGGSSEGAAQAGATPYLALNHWARAIETHNTNFPDCLHDCTDVQASDPRRYPSTNILIASPECTNHSLAKGVKRQPYKQDLFGNALINPQDERSRATMWDVVRFAEYHRYELCIIENVVDAAKWELFDEWLSAMHKLGYEHEAVYFNSQFAFPTPQSRDRMYVIFWRKGNRKPNLDFTPPAPCGPCGVVVNALQTWKGPKRWGRYGARRQYIYTCPKCRGEVTPYYFAAMNAIDWSVPAERIGDRKKPLQPKTMERIRYGLEKYGRNPLIITANHSGSAPGRVRDAATTPLYTALGSRELGIALPYYLQTTYTQANGSNVAGPESPTFTQTTRAALGMVAPALLGMAYTHDAEQRATSAGEVLPTQTVRGNLALLGFLSKQFSGEGHALPLNAPTGSLTTVDHHALITPLMVSVNDFDSRTIPATDQSGGTQTTQDKWAIAAPSFIAEMHGTSKAAPITDSLMCIATSQHHALIRPDSLAQYMIATGQPRDVGELQSMLDRLTVDDLTFRMLKAHEIQRGMAFPDTYQVLGNTTERIKQLGNAVTPPVMQMLVERCVASLEYQP
jgi:DNA (cytosine-5)-methyltransferase 1